MGRNTVGKGEIARYEQFLLFPQCFQKACFPGASKGVIVWEWVKPLPQSQLLTALNWKPFEYIVKKGENVGPTHPKTDFHFSVTSIWSSAKGIQFGSF